MPSTKPTFSTRPICRLGLISVTLLSLSACATVPSATPSAVLPAVPAQWQNTTATTTPPAAALATWWQQFNDPVLNQLVQTALQQAPDVRTALAKVEESRARHQVTRAGLFPSLSASVSNSGQRSTNRNTNVTTQSESASASLDASWELDLFGKNRLSAGAAAADLRQTEAALQNAQATLAAEVASSYLSLREAEAQIAYFEKSLTMLEDAYQLTRWRAEAGTSSAIDVQQALSNLEQTRASLPTYRQTALEARNALALLCGQVPGALDQTLAVATGALPTVAASLALGIPADTLRQRPDVRAAGSAWEAAVARTGVAERNRLPSLSLSGSIGVEALRANELLSPEAKVASLVGNLTAPLFNAGSLKQTAQAQAAVATQARIAYESTILTALSEVENALSAITQRAERQASLAKAAVAATDYATLARQRYDAGDVDFTTVLDAQRTQIDVESSLVSSQAAVLSAHVQLYKALGGGWTQL